ncbi:MAG: hypothetical protein AAF790_13730 [Planctomycetota bacterium]
MSRRQTKNRRAGPPRGKLIIVGVLAVVLVGVWGNALLNGGRKPPADALRRRRAAAAASRPTPAVAPSTQAGVTPAADPIAIDWPQVPLSQAVLNDPFGKPEWAVPPAPSVAAEAETDAPLAAASATPEQLRDAGASVILISGGERVAVIGDIEVRVGDAVGRYTVLDITPQGVVLSETAGLGERRTPATR